MAKLPAIALRELELGPGCSLALAIPFSSLLRTSPGPARSAAAHAALCSILGRLANRSPASLGFAKTGQGKPYLQGIDSIAFNISHSKAYSLIAVSRSGAIGCDIEDRFADDDVRDLCPPILHPVELEAMDRLPAADQRDAFRRYWVRKEAVLKAVGSGFLDDPRRLITGLEDAQARWSTHQGPRLTIHNQLIEAGCVAAVAGTDPACSWHLLDS
jgi:4'-phosphopantetheinyl transferase